MTNEEIEEFISTLDNTEKPFTKNRRKDFKRKKDFLAKRKQIIRNKYTLSENHFLEEESLYYRINLLTSGYILRFNPTKLSTLDKSLNQEYAYEFYYRDSRNRHYRPNDWEIQLEEEYDYINEYNYEMEDYYNFYSDKEYWYEILDVYGDMEMNNTLHLLPFKIKDSI